MKKKICLIERRIELPIVAIETYETNFLYAQSRYILRVTLLE